VTPREHASRPQRTGGGDEGERSARLDLLTTAENLPPDARAASDRIVESRGEISRPFQLLLHSPALAERVAELGHLVRFGSSLGDRDRELVTLATGRALGCAFMWASHLAAAAAAGLPAETVEMLERDPASLDTRDRILVSFVDELCGNAMVSAGTFDAVRELLEAPEIVELATTVGYYTMLGYVMGACDAC
jgi:4-carboxymuconolactone decarboxylase